MSLLLFAAMTVTFLALAVPVSAAPADGTIVVKRDGQQYLVHRRARIKTKPTRLAQAQKQSDGLFSWLFGSDAQQAEPPRRSNSRQGQSPNSRRSPQPLSPWAELFGGSFSGPSEPPAVWPEPAVKKAQPTYRTMCVRLCDGYYWPLSFNTNRSRFGAEEARCASSCSGETRLFYHRSNGEPEEMVDRRGRLYKNFANAFRYRKKLVPGCQCRPTPWSSAAAESYRARSISPTETASIPPAAAQTILTQDNTQLETSKLRLSIY